MQDSTPPAATRQLTTAQIQDRWIARQILDARRNSPTSLRALEYREEQERKEMEVQDFLESEAKRLSERTTLPVRRGYVPRFAKR